MNGPFYFKTHFHLVRLLGIRVKNPRQLLAGIKKVPLSSIYYHTHRFLRQHHYLSPEPPNDFAYWLTNILGVRDLGEQFFSVNTIDFHNLRELRAEFVTILENYVSKHKRNATCAEGLEFHFVSCKTFVLPTPYVAHDLKEFGEILSKISLNSLYYHMFEARMRLERNENDFSAWLKGIGYATIAREVSRFDPYTITLEGLRKKIIGIINRNARG